MMKRLYMFLMILVIVIGTTFISKESVAEEATSTKKVFITHTTPSAKKPPDEIKSFIEPVTKLLFLASEDLNGDNRKDYILVLQRQGKEYSDADNQRPFLILLRQGDGSLKLVKRNDQIIMCSTCGGGWGDPFEDIIVEKKSFEITQRGGGGHRWFVSYKFNYSNRDKTWQLVEVEESSFNINDINKEETHIYRPPRDYGKIDISEFDPHHYLGVGPK